MDWYKNMSEQQKKDFKKVIVTAATGAVLVLLVPTIFLIVL